MSTVTISREVAEAVLPLLMDFVDMVRHWKCEAPDYMIQRHEAEDKRISGLADSLRAALATPAPAQGWIAVSERLPERDRLVLIWTQDVPVERRESVPFIAALHRDGYWVDSFSRPIPALATHWQEMDMPAPPT